MDVGIRDTLNPAGNYVTLETKEGICILIAHLKQGSLLVLEG
ncbi:MAG: hypothetical protein FD169_155 [Bacillota bacterium]|nr:MAG: hypothetical protein FD169_155 [Bacillota bacterium]